MPKRVHASAFNLELVENRPKAVLDNFVRCIGSPVAIEEEKPSGFGRHVARYSFSIVTRASAIATGARLALLFTICTLPHQADRSTWIMRRSKSRSAFCSPTTSPTRSPVIAATANMVRYGSEASVMILRASSPSKNRVCLGNAPPSPVWPLPFRLVYAAARAFSVNAACLPTSSIRLESRKP